MPKFEFSAKKSPTEVVREVVEAANREEVLRHVASLGYVPIKVVEQQSAGEAAVVPAVDIPVPSRVMESFMRQFASLTRSQIPLLQALATLEGQMNHRGMKAILADIRDGIQREGRTLSESMKRYPRAFPPDQVNLIFAGETGGALQEILDQLAAKLEREESLRSKIQGAVVYPLFVGAVGLLTVLFLVTVVLPKILKTLEKLGGNLPLPTQILLTLTGWTGSLWFWLFLIGGGTLFALIAIPLIQRKREILDRFFLKIPVLGEMIQAVSLVRFCRSFGMLLDHGVLVLQALDAAIPVVGNLALRKDLMHVPEVVRDGRPLTEGFRSLSITTPYLQQSLHVGETGGRMAEVLKEVADYYEKEAEKKVQVFSALLEPVMILLVGGVVGFIVMAVMMPIFEVSVAVR